MSGKSNLSVQERAVRNARMAEDYRAGDTLAVISKRYALSMGAVFEIVRRSNGPLSREERRRRQSRASRANAARPGVRAKISQSMKQAWAEGRVKGGRPTLFADDPAKREDYLILRDALGAAEARKLMGIG